MSTEPTVAQWKWQHTISLTILSALTLGVAKSNEVFYDFYAKSFGLTSRDYRYILISMSFGGFLSIFIGPYIKKNINYLLNTNYNASFLLIMIYGVFGGLMCIVYPIPFVMTKNNYNLIIICNLIIAMIQGLFLVLIATQIFDYANNYSPPNKKGIIISVLSISWPLCTLLNIIIGYLLNNNQTQTIFYSFGIAIIIQLFLINFVLFPNQLKHKTESQQISVATLSTLKNQLAQIIASKTALSLLLIQFISCTSSGIINTTINGSWLKNVFNLNAFQIGIISITLFVAEIIGSVVTGKLLDNNSNKCFFPMYFMGVSIKLITATVLIIFVYLFSENVGSLITAIIIIFFMYVGWESVIVTQLYSYTYLLQNTDIKFETMFNISTSFTYIGRIIGIELTTLYWQNGKGLLILSVLATILFFVAILFRIFVYFQIKSEKSPHYDMVNSQLSQTDIDMDDFTNDENDNYDMDEIKVLCPS